MVPKVLTVLKVLKVLPGPRDRLEYKDRMASRVRAVFKDQ
jgi:hypothetical protein